VILVSAGLVGGLAFWYFADRFRPVPQGLLRIGFESNPPVQIRSADGGFGGLGVETLNQAAKRAGLRLQWVETGTSSEEAFRRGLVDLWPLMADLPERRKRVHFTTPWMHSGHAMLIRPSSAIPKRDFTGRIALHNMPLHIRILREHFPAARLDPEPNGVAVLTALCKGQAEASFMELRAARTALQANPPECTAVPLETHLLPDLTLNLGIASTFEASGAADRLRREIRALFRDGTLAITVAKYSYYGLDDTWATYDLLETEERARWNAAAVIAGILVVVGVIWRAVSSHQRRRAAAVLRESEERFRIMADNAPVMIWVTGPDTLFTFVNKTWLSFTGRTREEELGTGWAAGVHPEDLLRCNETFSSAFDARKSFHLECRLRRADGEYRSILCSGVPRFAPDGVFAGYIGSDIDITDVQSEERFRQLAENIDQVFWMLDAATSELLYISPAFEKVCGCQSTALHRDWLMQAVHPEDRERIAAVLRRASSEPTDDVCRIVRPDGSVRWIHGRTFPVCDPHGASYRIAGIAEDVTAHHELEEQLRQSSKMEAVGRLAGGIAHDFNNLLTVIGGYSQLQLEATRADDPGRGRLEQILGAANRASSLTSQLLAFSRRQVLQPKLVNVNHVLTNMEALLRRIIGEHIAIETALDPALACIKVDPHQLEQVVMNLAANARDAMPNAGQFRIATRMVQAADRQNENSPGRTGKYVHLRISDTGCGMDQRTRERAFEPFFTTKGVGKGTGLGLSTVYGIVEQNHGTISVSSELGQGTVFDIYFPAAPEGEAGSEQTASQPLRTEAAETILVAEDEPAVRGLIRYTLEQLGYTVLEAADGYEALRILEQGGPEIHLLVTDVIMPLMNGRELASRLESIRPGTKVLYMSGYTAEVLAFHGIDQPEIDFIQKPFTPAVVAAKVEMVLAANRESTSG
jgi:PAS domain S-box-containing protein